jgi:hypothetical protein
MNGKAKLQIIETLKKEGKLGVTPISYDGK